MRSLLRRSDGFNHPIHLPGGEPRRDDPLRLPGVPRDPPRRIVGASTIPAFLDLPLRKSGVHHRPAWCTAPPRGGSRPDGRRGARSSAQASQSEASAISSLAHQKAQAITANPSGAPPHRGHDGLQPRRRGRQPGPLLSGQCLPAARGWASAPDTPLVLRATPVRPTQRCERLRSGGTQGRPRVPAHVTVCWHDRELP